MTSVEKLAKEHYPEYYSAGLGVDRIGFERGYNLAKETQLPQQEISDEEINNGWEEFRIQNPNTVGGFKDQYESFSFAIKWYREKLKK